MLLRVTFLILKYRLIFVKPELIPDSANHFRVDQKKPYFIMILEFLLWPIHEEVIIKRVQNQNCESGCPRKVFKQGKAHRSFTGKLVTAHGGMENISRGLDCFGVK